MKKCLFQIIIYTTKYIDADCELLFDYKARQDDECKLKLLKFN